MFSILHAIKGVVPPHWNRGGSGFSFCEAIIIVNGGDCKLKIWSKTQHPPAAADFPAAFYFGRWKACNSEEKFRLSAAD
jgi:hypothetical protein